MIRSIDRRLGRAVTLGLLLMGAAMAGLTGCHDSSSDSAVAIAASGTPIPMSGAHIAIELRDVNGNPIDVTQAEAAPYSPKQTCGYCHPYSTIEQGYHFQQGAELLADNYGTTNGPYPWYLSPGMAGKW